MLVMAAPAFAKTGTKSGGYWPYNATANQFIGAGTNWASATVSPHSGYTINTGKCKVCHAVHGAGITTADQTAMQPSEKLLRSTANDACNFCHLTAGAFAMDPYYDPNSFLADGHTVNPSITNYYSNDSSPPTGVPVWTLNGVQDSSAGRSGHNATHGHDNPQGVTADLKSYKGCVSCHSVHGAQTMGTGQFILKNDPAKGVTAAEGNGWGTGGTGYGSKQAPTTTQIEFCEDCHDGTKLVPTTGAAIPIVSQADFNKYFPSCGVTNTTGSLCHNSVQTTITESVAQFGAFANYGHNGRSHTMVANGDIDPAIAGTDTRVTVEGLTAQTNSCATCHNVRKYNATQGFNQGATFPHYAKTNELISGWAAISQSDNPCMNCHGGRVGVNF